MRAGLVPALALLATALALHGGAVFARAPVELEPAAALPAPPAALQAALDAVHGKVVIVNFWASWCEPCRVEMPALVDLDEREADVALITVAVADRAADTRRFLDENLIQGLVVVADPDQRIARAWSARLLPTTYVLDPRHRPRYRVQGEADWHDAGLRARIRALTTESKGNLK